MSSAVLKLISTEIEYPSDRLAEFINLARKIEALVPNDEWEADIWHVGRSFVTKGQNRDRRTLAFYNRDATLTRQEVVGGAPLAGSFKEFAKAYIRYLHSASPVLFEPTVKRLGALQFIEASFRSLNLEPLIVNLNVTVLNTAVSMAKEGVGPGRHYQLAIGIHQVHRFCLERGFLVAPFQWKHGIRKPKDRTEEIGKDAKGWRDQKLPSPEAYLALAYIYRNSETFVDRLYSAITAIFVSIPIRIHEVLQLRLDCEVFEKVTDPETGEVSDAYGIRVFPGKGNPPQVKWVPTQMVTLVQEAVNRIREMCADARAVALWYETNPDKLWLPGHLEGYRDDEWLAVEHVACLLPSQERKKVLWWIRECQIDFRSGPGSRSAIKQVRLSSLARFHLAKLPRGFPKFNGNQDQNYSETLALLFLNQANAQKGIYPTVVEQVTIQSYSIWLGGHGDRAMSSVFDRWNFLERDGSPIRITSHSFRHWLNTVAQLRGLSEIDIAKWSGRDIAHNKAYNHVTPEETLSLIRAALDDGNGVGPMFEAARMVGINRPVDRRDFADAQIGAALTTEIGICVHDYSLLPCQTHGDCLGCSENVFIKGDAKHRERISKRLALSVKQLDDAIRAMGADRYGADRWVRSHEASIATMQEMLAIHDDPTIPDRTVVNLRGGSRDGEVAMALRDRDGSMGTPREAGAVMEANDDLPGDILEDMWED